MPPLIKLISRVFLAVGGAFYAVSAAACVRGASRVLVALALCLSAPVMALSEPIGGLPPPPDCYNSPFYQLGLYQFLPWECRNLPTPPETPEPPTPETPEPPAPKPAQEPRDINTGNEPKADYTGLYAIAGVVILGAATPDWIDTQTFAFSEGGNLVIGQSLSVPLDDFTFAATRVQVNNTADYEFGVKWEMEF